MKEKKLNRYENIDRIAEQTASGIIQASKESKLRIHSNLWRSHFSFTYSFKFTNKCFVRLAFHNSYEDTNWVKNHCRFLGLLATAAF